MQVISGTTEFECDMNTAAAIGKFDGIHLGHRKLLEKVLKAKEDGLAAAVFTFDPAPGVFFSGKPQAGLTTKDEKRRCFEEMGVDILIEFPMNAETAAIPAEAFVEEVLCEKMHAKLLVAGTDLSFGDGGKGDWHLLRAMSDRFGYQVEIIDKIMYGGREISSTYVRSAVQQGEMELAERLLGAPYSISGRVMHGKRLGRALGMPTVNLLPDKDKLLPPNGVYLSRMGFAGVSFAGITNIGCRPTVSDSGRMSVETYLYDFDSDIYDEFVEVSLYSFRRPEKKFADVKELQKNMERDIADGRNYWYGSFGKTD